MTQNTAGVLFISSSNCLSFASTQVLPRFLVGSTLLIFLSFASTQVLPSFWWGPRCSYFYPSRALRFSPVFGWGPRCSYCYPSRALRFSPGFWWVHVAHIFILREHLGSPQCLVGSTLLIFLSFASTQVLPRFLVGPRCSYFEFPVFCYLFCLSSCCVLCILYCQCLWFVHS